MYIFPITTHFVLLFSGSA